MEGAEEESCSTISVDTSWIKEEPVDEELYIDVLQMSCEEDDHDGNEEAIQHGQEGSDEGSIGSDVGENWCVKRKHDDKDQDEHESPTKIVMKRMKQEPVYDYSENIVRDGLEIADGLEISAENVKEEENETDTEEDSDDESVDDEGQPHARDMKKCAKCAKMFMLQSSRLPTPLQKFCNKCRPSVSITCKYCGKHFEHHKLYSRHVKECSKDSLRCRHCQDVFTTNQHLIRHKCAWAQNVRLLRFVCPICSEGFDKNKTRNNHKSLHVAPRTLKCSHCCELFEDVWQYQRHLDDHLVCRQFICTFCLKSFETRSLFDADQSKHQKELGDDFELRPAPDFVYVCKACKNWYPSMLYFERHDCQAVSIRDPSSLTNVVMRALDFGISAGTPKKKSPARSLQSSPNITYIPPVKKQSVAPSSKQASENLTLDLDSSFTCQLCKDTFMTADALGYHPCLVMHSGFDMNDSDSEEEDENLRISPAVTRTGALPNNFIPADDGCVLVDQAVDAASNECKPLPGKVNFSYIQPRTEPPSGKTRTGPSTVGTLMEQDDSGVVQIDLCYMCGRQVRHKFAPCIGKKPSKYICTPCLHVLGKMPMYKFKCSKCWQVFPTLARLHMHMPWHKNESDAEDQIVFRKPRLSCIRSKDGKLDECSATSGVTWHPEGQVSTSTDQDITSKAQSSSFPQNDPRVTVQPLIQGINPITSKAQSGSMPQNDPRVAVQPLIQGINPMFSDQSLNAGTFTKALPTTLTMAKAGNIFNNISINIPQGSTVRQPLLPKTAVSLPVVNQPAQELLTVNSSVQQQHVILDIGTIGQPRRLVSVLPVPVLQNNQQKVQVVQVPGLPMNTTSNVSSVTQSAPVQRVSNETSRSKPTSTSALERLLLAPQEPLKKMAVYNKGNASSISNKPVSGTPTSKMAHIAPRPVQISVVATGESTAEVTLSANGSQQTNKVGLQVANKVTGQTNSMVGIQTVHQIAKAVGLQPANKENPKGYFLCNSCNTLCKDIEELKKHGCEIRVYTCHLCSEKFDEPEKLYKHRCKAQAFLCHMCQKKCSSAEELNQHPCIDSSDIRFVSSMGTNKDTGDDRRLNNDQSGNTAKPSEESGIRCPKCSQKFNTRTAMYIHKMRHNLKT